MKVSKLSPCFRIVFKVQKSIISKKISYIYPSTNDFHIIKCLDTHCESMYYKAGSVLCVCLCNVSLSDCLQMKLPQ